MSLNIWQLFLSFALLLVAMSVHEFAHAWVAYKLGDYSAKQMGRLTLNPLAHIDIFGTIILPLLLFVSSAGRFIIGYAKPVPVNFAALSNPRRDILWVGLAGPLANLIFAFLLSFLLKLIAKENFLYGLLLYLVVINIFLGVFNLVPIPPLDGSKVLLGLLPQRMAIKYIALEPFGFLIIMFLVISGGLRFIVMPLVELLLSVMGLAY